MRSSSSSSSSSRITETTHYLPNSSAKCKIVDHESQLGVIICHPWGLLGGNMNNNVVIALAQFFMRMGITTLRMDFAGRQIGRGYGEVDQVVEASNFLLQNKHDEMNSRSNQGPPTCLLLVGYSYGSLITGSATAKIPRCIGTISVAPPFGVSHWLLLFNSSYHSKQSQARSQLYRLFVIGEHDNFTSTDTFLKAIESYETSRSTHKVLPKLDHFFARQEYRIIHEVDLWLRQTFSSSQSKNDKNISFRDNDFSIYINESDSQTT